jgi:Right handed beta helix region
MLAPADAIILHVADNIPAIVRAAPAGATFFFEPGVYRGLSLAPKEGQTFIGAQGAILNGSEVLTNWTQSGNLWVIGGQKQQGRARTDVGVSGFQRAGYPETVFVDDKPLKPVDALSKVVPGTFYFDYAADRIYIADNPTGHKIEAGKLVDAFHGTATNVTIKNLVVEKYDAPAQHAAIHGGSGWIVEDNEVRLNYGVGVKLQGGSQIIGNFVHDNGQLGLGGSGKNILVERNDISKNGFWSGIKTGWEAGGFKFTRTVGLKVVNNYSHDNNGPGMWTDINNIHTLYENNLVVHNTGAGITHEISYDAIIRNNIVISNGTRPRSWWWGNQIQIQNSQNVEVYGNRVDMTGRGNGIALIQQNRSSDYANNGPAFGPYLTTGNNIYDNIIVDRDGQGWIGGVTDYNQSLMLNGNNWDHNQYFMSDVSGRFQWGGSKTFSGFESTTAGTGSTISQTYPNSSNWSTDWLGAHPTVATSGEIGNAAKSTP